jgi:hypothetical protein
VTDAVYALLHHFGGGTPPPAPVEVEARVGPESHALGNLGLMKANALTRSTEDSSVDPSHHPMENCDAMARMSIREMEVEAIHENRSS